MCLVSIAVSAQHVEVVGQIMAMKLLPWLSRQPGIPECSVTNISILHKPVLFWQAH